MPTPENRDATPPPAGKLAGRLMMVAAALLWSSSGLFVKSGVFDDWPELARGPLLAFWRSVFAGLVLLPIVRRPRWHRELIPLGLCFVAVTVTFLTSMSLTTAANAIWLQAVYPWWVFLIVVAVLRQPIVRRDTIPLGFAAAGVLTILGGEIAFGGGTSLVGVGCGLASSLFFAAIMIYMQRLGDQNTPWVVAVCHIATAGVLLPVPFALGIWPDARQLVVLALFGSIQLAAPYVLMFRALRRISSLEAAAIGLLEPVINPLWVLFFVGEPPAGWTVVGAALILVGLLLRYVVVPAMANNRRTELFTPLFRRKGGSGKV